MKGSGADRGLWTVLLLLMFVVLVPTGGVFWFMAAAVENERLAVEQKLTSAHRSQLAGIERQLASIWEGKERALAAAGSTAEPAATFAGLVRSGVADSVVLLDDEGEPRYPTGSGGASAPAKEPAVWAEAQRLEFAAGDPASAAEAYGRIAESAADPDLAARAFQARARCLVKSGDAEAAIVLLARLFEEPHRGARDPRGRSIAADAQLLGLQLVEDGESSASIGFRERLQELLTDYAAPGMPPNQRRFLMRELRRETGEDVPFDTLAAEDLAAEYLETASRPRDGETGFSELPGVLHWGIPGGRSIALYRTESLQGELGASLSPPEDLRVELVPPGGTGGDQVAFLSRVTGDYLPGWHLDLFLSDRDAIESAARGQVTAYLWGGALVILGIVGVGILIARLIGRQMRQTRLKNDLVATVTHELKTPLAGMRLLVDTLLESDRRDEDQVREYLELISKENERLTRLIEDFLTFSRMERNKQSFDKVELAPAELVETAAASVRGRFDPKQVRFEVDVAEDLPKIVGDADALSTVLVNLLDNAYKYTEEEKRIVLRTYPLNGAVFFEVEDNGVGISRRAAKRIFDRFYQADQNLSRHGGGVGLGLSIVEFIVRAHGGAISVDSEPGRGSTFRVRLPAAPAEAVV